MSQRKRKMLLAASLIGVATSVSLGQTWISSNGSWSDVSKWSAQPLPSDTTTLMFPMLGAGTLAYTSTNDLPGPFTLDDIAVSGIAGGSVVLGSGGTSSLKFGSFSPAVSVSTGGNVLINARSFVSTANPLSLTASPTGSITFAGVMRNAGMTINSGGTVALLSENRIRGTVAVNNARLNLGNVNSVGDATLSLNSASLSLGPSTFATAPNSAPYFRNAITTTGGGVFLGDNRSFTLAGDISGNGGITVLPSALSMGTWTLAGNNSFTGGIAVFQAPGTVSPILNMLAVTGPAAVGSASGISLIGQGAAIGFLGQGAGYAISQNITLNGGGAISVIDARTRGNVTLNGAISGSGGLHRIGEGVLTLGADNSFSGGLTLSGGFTQADADARLGVVGGTLNFNGGGLQVGSAFATSARTILASFGGGTLQTDGDVVWTGAILNNGTTPGKLYKNGPGNLFLTNSTNGIGSFIINGGTVTTAGAGRIQTNGSLTINQGAALVLDNSVSATARIGTATPVNLAGGTFRLVGNATVNTSATTTGNLTLGAIFNSGQGVATIEAIPGAGANAAVRFNAIGRTANNGAHLVFNGTGLGDAPVASLSTGKANISFATAPALVNGILPYAIMDRGAGKELASYIAANGVVPATYTNTTINVGTSVIDNVAVGSDTITAAARVNAAKFTGGVVDLTAGTLSVGSGAILITGATTFNGGTLTVGVGTNNTTEAPTANLFVHADTVINSRLFIFTNNGGGLTSGLAKSGPGVLTLSNSATNWGGFTRILEGTLRLGNNNIIPNGSTVVMNPGATLDLNGFSDTMGALVSVAPVSDVGNYPVGTILTGSNILSVGGENGSGLTYDNIVGTGTLVKSGTGTLGVMGNQEFSGVMTIANGTLELHTHQTTGTGMRNVSRINVGTAGTSGEVGLRFESGLVSFDRPIFVQAQTGRNATISFADDAGGVVSSPITLTTAQGVIINAAGGPELSGTISGVNFPLTTTTTGIGVVDSRNYSLRISGNNTYTGTTTLAADSTVWGHPNAFGLATTAILLGSNSGDDMPELSGDVGGTTLARQINVQGSTSAAPVQAIIGSRAPAGSGTITYSSLINISGSRGKLILFSNGEPVNFAGSIVGGAVSVNPLANVQIGHAFSAQDVTTRSNVILSGSNTYGAGATLAAGTVAINANSSTVGSNITGSPLGTGTFTIGVPTLAVGHEPTIVALGTARTILNPVNVTRNFRIAGDLPLTFGGPIELGSSAKIMVVESTAPVTINGAITGAASAALVKEGTGQLNINGGFNFAGDLVIADGTATLGTQSYGGRVHVGPGATASNQASSKVVTASALSVDASNGGRYNVADGGFVVDYTGASPLSAVTALLGIGHANGSWNGNGIQSSFAAADASFRTGVGVIEAADTGATNLLGSTFSGDAILIAATLNGDANLDRTVNISDFALLASNFNQPSRWYTGDFDYDGVTDIGDFAMLAANFNQTFVAPLARGSAVPEPMFVLPSCVLLALSRRRRG